MRVRVSGVRFWFFVVDTMLSVWAATPVSAHASMPSRIPIPYTHRPLGSSFLGLPYRIHKEELLRGLWVASLSRSCVAREALEKTYRRHHGLPGYAAVPGAGARNQEAPWQKRI